MTKDGDYQISAFVVTLWSNAQSLLIVVLSVLKTISIIWNHI